MGVKPQSSGQAYSNTVTGTLAVDGWAAAYGTSHPSTASVPISHYYIDFISHQNAMWHYNYLIIMIIRRLITNQSIKMFICKAPLKQCSQRRLLEVCTLKKPCL